MRNGAAIVALGSFLACSRNDGRGDVTAMTDASAVDGGSAYPTVLDGVSHEEVYTTGAHPRSRTERLAWKVVP